MPSQFMHISTFGRRARKGAATTATIVGILMEASRRPGAIAHIDKPLSPVLLHGADPATLIDEALTVSDVGRDMSGRHIRLDGGTLVGGVLSYPTKRSVTEASSHERDKCNAWFKKARGWLQQRFGDHLRSVVAHLDEEYPHLHFFLIANLRSDDLLDWASIHPGLEAKRMSSLRGESTRIQDARYRVAMRALQDEFHEAVSSFFGHDRFGPRRKRVHRQEAVSRQAIETQREVILAQVKLQQDELRRKIAACEHWFDHAKQHFEELLLASMIRLKPVERNLLLAQFRRTFLDKKSDFIASFQLPDHGPPIP